MTPDSLAASKLHKILWTKRGFSACGGPGVLEMYRGTTKHSDVSMKVVLSGMFAHTGFEVLPPTG